MTIDHTNCSKRPIQNISLVYLHISVHQHGAVEEEDLVINVRELGSTEQNLKLYFEPGESQETK